MWDTAIIYLKSALILFVVVWTAWAGQQTENSVVFYDGIDVEVIITNGKILAKHVSRGKRISGSSSTGTFCASVYTSVWVGMIHPAAARIYT